MIPDGLTLPATIDLVGGPYCGCTLKTFYEQIWDWNSGSGMPTNFYELEPGVVGFEGSHGVAVHTFDGSFWMYDSDLSDLLNE